MNWIIAKSVKSIRDRIGIVSPSKVMLDIGKKINIGFMTGQMDADIEAIENKRPPYRYGKVYPTKPYLPYPYSAMKSLKEWYWYY